MARPSIALSALALATACAGTSAAPIDRFITSWQARVDSYCGRCYTSGGWPSEEHCRGHVGTASALGGDLDTEERACMREVHATDAAALDPVLSCIADALDAYTACIATCPPSTGDTCFPAFSTAEARCREGGPASYDALTACAPPAD